MALPVRSTTPARTIAPVPLPRAAPSPPPRHGPVAALRGRRALRTASIACRLLRRRGWTTRLTEFRIAGDVDVRLLAALPDKAVAVELLCPCPDDADGVGPWAAVRIRAEDDRTVWHGPDRSCTAATLARFIDDLARRPDPDLGRSYEMCG